MRDVLDDRSSAQIKYALQFSRVWMARTSEVYHWKVIGSHLRTPVKSQAAVVVELTVYLKSRLISAGDDSWQLAPDVA